MFSVNLNSPPGTSLAAIDDRLQADGGGADEDARGAVRLQLRSRAVAAAASAAAARAPAWTSRSCPRRSARAACSTCSTQARAAGQTDSGRAGQRQRAESARRRRRLRRRRYGQRQRAVGRSRSVDAEPDRRSGDRHDVHHPGHRGRPELQQRRQPRAAHPAGSRAHGAAQRDLAVGGDRAAYRRQRLGRHPVSTRRARRSSTSPWSPPTPTASTSTSWPAIPVGTGAAAGGGGGTSASSTTSTTPTIVTLGQVATISYGTGPVQIQRVDRNRTMTITGTAAGTSDRRCGQRRHHGDEPRSRCPLATATSCAVACSSSTTPSPRSARRWCCRSSSSTCCWSRCTSRGSTRSC